MRFAVAHLQVGLGLLAATLLASLTKGQDTVVLGFPASRIVGQADRPSSVFLVGGDALAAFDCGSLKLGKLHHIEELRLVSADCLGEHQLALAGTREIEHGFIGVADVAANPRFKWIFETQLPVTSVCMSGDRVLAADEAGELMALDRVHGRLLWRRALHAKMVTSLAHISQDICASADWTGKIVVFNATDGTEITNFQQHRDRVIGLVAAADQSLPRLYSASRDGTVRLWYPTQKRLVRFSQLALPITAFCHWSDGVLVVATNDAKLHVVDMSRALETYACGSGLDYVTSLFAIDAEQVLAVDGKSRTSRIRISSPD